MKKIKIGYFADGPWSHKAFELLIKDPSVEIKFIVPRSDTKDQTLLKYANKYQIDYHIGVDVNSDTFYQIVKHSEIDLAVSMSFNQIFKNKIANAPALGSINCHAGKLPFYRGRNILNWVIINDEADFGITVHYIDEGIDTGDIILQRSFPITDNDDYNTLLNVAYEQCAIILYDSIKLIQNNKQVRLNQKLINLLCFLFFSLFLDQ
jgi:methionyl-tRNA formyltransferase